MSVIATHFLRTSMPAVQRGSRPGPSQPPTVAKGPETHLDPASSRQQAYAYPLQTAKSPKIVPGAYLGIDSTGAAWGPTAIAPHRARDRRHRAVGVCRRGGQVF